MKNKFHWTKSSLIFGGAAIWGLFLVGCVVADRTVVAPPKIAGANYVGSKKCAECHEDQASHFGGSTHAKLAMKDDKGMDISCESCHGGGSVHVKAGGGKGTMINPDKSPETCFACHLDARSQFAMPNSHPVMRGKVTCSDCHELHSGDAVKGTGADMEAQNETCTKCHSAQKGPFVFEHGAMRDGCVSCHNPHGTVNQKMLVARDANLCLRCHLEAPSVANNGEINANSIRHTTENHNSRMQQGTCWSNGCHETVHGSNTSYHFRY